jgi:EmrB/QacA subfamily drug resistance transporter
VLIVTSAATFVAFLDMSVVNVAFPSMRASFPAASLATLSWVLSGYAVVFAAALAAAGSYADRVGRRTIFLWSLSVFTVASGLCAAAPDAQALIAARALQGLGAAGMIPSGLGLVLSAYPPAQRLAAVAAWAGVGSAAAGIGPALGGLLVSALDWRAVFLINLPVGIAAVAAGLRWLPETRVARTARPDLAGTILIGCGVAAFTAGLTQASTLGWTSPLVLAALLAGPAAAAAGVLRSARHPAPALEITLWRSRGFAAGTVASLFFGTAMYAWMLCGPLFVIAIWHYSVLKAGLANTPGAVTAAIGAAIVGRSRHPAITRIATVAGSLLFSGVCITFALTLTTRPHFLAIWLPVGLAGGLAVGLVLTAVSGAAATALPQQQFPSGFGALLTARQLGGGLGIAAFAAIISATHSGLLDGMHAVFAFCAVAAVPAAAAGLALSLNRPDASAAAAPATGADDPATGADDPATGADDQTTAASDPATQR